MVLDPKIMLREEKARLRQTALARREALPDREARSAKIHAAVLGHPAWVEARAISTYVGVGSEVGTLPLITAALAQGKRIVVPVVEGENLALFRIDAVDELVPAPFGLLEPRKELRRKPRRITATTVHLFLVPGLAFDLEGGRLGYGKGFYDGLLGRIKPRIPTYGLAFEEQLVDRVPMGPSDIPLTGVITEARVCVRSSGERPVR